MFSKKNAIFFYLSNFFVKNKVILIKSCWEKWNDIFLWDFFVRWVVVVIKKGFWLKIIMQNICKKKTILGYIFCVIFFWLNKIVWRKLYFSDYFFWFLKNFVKKVFDKESYFWSRFFVIFFDLVLSQNFTNSNEKTRHDNLMTEWPRGPCWWKSCKQETPTLLNNAEKRLISKEIHF